MKRVLRFLMPDRISSQIALIIIGSLVAVHVILTTIFLLHSFERHQDHPHSNPGAIEALVVLLDAAAPQERRRLAGSMATAFPDLSLRLERSRSFDWSTLPAPPEDLNRFVRHLGPGFQVMPDREAGVAAGRPPRIAVRLRDGDVVSAQFPPLSHWRLFDPILVTIFLIALIMIFLGLWAARAVTAPLRSFATAAESFVPDGVITPLPQRGPREVRAAARALNHLRARVKTLLEDRTRMLIAVGHDLRTPITRLRLTSEFVGDASLRQQMLRDLDQMKVMVESILVFMREGRSGRTPVAVDIAAAVQTVCDEFADTGHDVRLVAIANIAVLARPDELHRAITNVVDNAVRYAGAATVRTEPVAGGVAIVVEDAGPGIPDDRKEAMLQPFVRGSAARSMDDASGFGLGLSIASAIVKGAGGSLTLHDRESGGLMVRMELPDAPPMAAISRLTAAA
jgi:signal transduction histidine kinase